MKRQSRPAARQPWTPLILSTLAGPDRLLVRKETLAPRHYFPEHRHDWHQLVYAISGALAVTTEGRSFVISPDQAVWLPVGTKHQVGSLLGAEFRSLWIAKRFRPASLRGVGVVNVTPLMRALIIEAGVEKPAEDSAYAGRVVRLLMDQLERASRVELSLAWPSDPTLLKICDQLYANPAIDISLQDWAQRLGTSTRTLTRTFEAHLGMTLREWKRRLRLFRSVELLSDGRSMTQIAFELGYSSTSAFIYMFKQEMGVSPRRYREHISIEG